MCFADSGGSVQSRHEFLIIFTLDIIEETLVKEVQNGISPSEQICRSLMVQIVPA